MQTNMTNYNNFHASLAKEQDAGAQEQLARFYDMYFSNYNPIPVDYNSGYGMYLQHGGVDRILLSRGSTFSQLWIQEKISLKNHDNFLFEIEKKSGAEGWGISPQERADYLVYYMGGEIYIFQYEALKTWLRANLKSLRANYYFKTDNHNVIIPKSKVFEELNAEVVNVIALDKNLNRI